MSTHTVDKVLQDDEEPEEGEIQEDEDDDFIYSEIPSAPKTSDTFVSPTRMKSYDQDIRNFEIHFKRSRRTSKDSWDPRTMGTARANKESTTLPRTKDRHHLTSHTSLHHGKENRHHDVRSSTLASVESRDESPPQIRPSSPVYRGSSRSSVDSEEPHLTSKTRHKKKSKYKHKHREHVEKSGRKRSEPEEPPQREKRKLNSVGNEHFPVKRKAISVTPLIQIISKETKLITSDKPDSGVEESSLKTRLCNMGIIPKNSIQTEVENKENQSESDGVNEKKKEQINADDGVMFLGEARKPDPILVTLTDSEDGASTCESEIASSKRADQDLQAINDCLNLSTESENTVSGSGLEEDDDADLRRIALESKKSDSSTQDEKDILQLRAAALKTAILKRFKERKQKKTSSVVEESESSVPVPPPPSFDPPRTPPAPPPPTISYNAEEVPPPVPVDEVITPVDMDLADTDEDSRLSSEPYSPTNPTLSPSYEETETSLHELLPPPPPADLPLDPFYPDNAMPNPVFLTNKPLSPPPLPQMFRDMLMIPTTETPEFSPAPWDFTIVETSSYIPKTDEVCKMLTDSVVNEPNSSLPNTEYCDNVVSTNGEELQNLQGEPMQEDTFPPEHMDINSMIVIDEVYDYVSTPESQSYKSSLEEEANEKNTLVEEDEEKLRQQLLQTILNKRENVKSPAAKINSENTVPKIASPVQEKVPIPISSPVPEKADTADSVQIQVKKPVLSEVNSQIAKTVSSLSTMVKSSNLPLQKISDSSDSSFKSNSSDQQSSPASKPQTPISTYHPVVETRLIIKLGPDSDSSDCSETESPIQQKPDLPSPKVIPKKISGNNNKTAIKRSASLISKSAKRLPNPEEERVERFLKSIRNIHDSSASSSTANTPVAVRHLPKSKQEEYRRLKQKLAEKEREIKLMKDPKNSSNLKIKKGQSIVNANSTGSESAPPKKACLTADKLQNSVKPLSPQNLVKPVSSQNLVKPVSAQTVVKPVPSQNLLKPVSSQNLVKQVPSQNLLKPVSSQNLVKPVSSPNLVNSVSAQTVVKPISSQNLVKPVSSQNLVKPISSQNLVKPISPSPSTPVLNPNAQQIPEKLNSVLNSDQSPSLDKNEVNVSNCVSSKVKSLNQEKTVKISVTVNSSGTGFENDSRKVYVTKTLADKSPKVNKKKVLELKKAEEQLFFERSSIRKKVSDFSGLLEKVDKAFEEQKERNKELSDLIDLLNAAQTNWKNQHNAVLKLVSLVAVRQKDITETNKRCWQLTKDCKSLGKSVHGESYTVPSKQSSLLKKELKHIYGYSQSLAAKQIQGQKDRNNLRKKVTECMIEMGKNGCAIEQTAKKNIKAVSTGSDNINRPEATSINSAAESNNDESNATTSSAKKQENTQESPMLTNQENQMSSSKVVENKNQVSNINRVDTENVKLADNSEDSTTTSSLVDNIPENKPPKEAVFDDSAPILNDSENKCESEKMEECSTKEGQTTAKDADAQLNCICDAAEKICPPQSKQNESPNCIPAKHNSFTYTNYVSPLSGLPSLRSLDANQMEENNDHNLYLCPYDLNGKCQDADCSYRHW